MCLWEGREPQIPGHREASRAGLLVGLGPFLLGADPSIQASSLWGGEWQARQGREEREHVPWQLAVSDAGPACCRTPILSRVGRDCASRAAQITRLGVGDTGLSLL